MTLKKGRNQIRTTAQYVEASGNGAGCAQSPGLDTAKTEREKAITHLVKSAGAGGIGSMTLGNTKLEQLESHAHDGKGETYGLAPYPVPPWEWRKQSDRFMLLTAGSHGWH
jgi:hypothetical protein